MPRRAAVALGIVVLLFAAASAIGTGRWIARSAVAPGRVVRLNAGGSHPEVAFTAASGEVVSYPQGGLVAGWRVGDRVPVRYDPAAPRTDPCIDRVAALWTWPLFLLAIGAGALAGGLFGRDPA